MADTGTPGAGPPDEGGVVGVISATGAILVVGLGLMFVFVLAVVSLGTLPDEQKSTVIAAAFTVIGTVVGTYFGVRAGSAGKERAEAARELESTKVQELAAHLDPNTAHDAMDRAAKRVVAERSASQPDLPAL